MNCHTCRELLDRRGDRAPDNLLKGGSEAHISACAACAQYQASFARVVRLFASDEHLQAPANLRVNVMARIEDETARQQPRRRSIFVVLATASFILAMLVAVGAFVGLGLLISASPAAGAGLVHALLKLAEYLLSVSGGLWTTGGALLEWLASQPLLPGGLVASGALSLLWIYLVRHLKVATQSKVVTR